MEVNTIVENFGKTNNDFIFIILLIWITIYIYFKYIQWKNREICINENLTKAYSPDTCQDWVRDELAGSKVCSNVNNIGNSSISDIDFQIQNIVKYQTEIIINVFGQ